MLATTLLVQAADQPNAEAGAKDWYATVTRVLDGDTVEVKWESGGRPSGLSRPNAVRFVGVDTNELSKRECLAQEATDFVAEKIPPGTRIRLEANKKTSSAYGRPLRHIFYGDNYEQNLGLELVEAGLGLAASYEAEPGYREDYYRAAETASLAQRGLWEPDACGGNAKKWPSIDVNVIFDAPGIDARNLNGEKVVIKNTGKKKLVMKGWTIRKGGRIGNDGQHRLPNRTIAPGKKLTIYMGAGKNTAKKVYLDLDEPYLRNESDVVYLRDKKLNIRHFEVWPCQLTCETDGTLAVEEAFVDAPGADNKNPNGEWITLRNRGAETIKLKKWKVQTNRSVFTLPKGKLGPGESIKVYMGKGKRSPGTLYWGSNKSVLANARGKLRVTSSEGEKVDCFAWGAAKCKSEPVGGAITMSAQYGTVGDETTNPNGEWIVLANTSASKVNLSGYSITVGPHSYTFADGTKIKPDARLRLLVGSGTDTKVAKFWGHSTEVMNDAGGSAQLRDRGGLAILATNWPCVDCGPDGPFVIDNVRYGTTQNSEQFVTIRNAGLLRANLRDFTLEVRDQRIWFAKDQWLKPGESAKIPTAAIRGEGSVISLRSPFQEIADCHGWGDQACKPGEQGPSAAIAWHLQWDAEGNDAVNLNGEWVDLHNTSTGEIRLDGYSLTSDGKTYEFGAADIIPPGKTLRVFSGPGTDSGLSRYADNDLAPLANTHDEVLLISPGGNTALTMSY